MSGRVLRGMAVTATSVVLVAGSAVGASAKQQDSPAVAKVRQVLTGMDLSSQQINQIVADPTLVAEVPVSESYEETSGSAPARSALTVPSAVGSNCSGSSGWVQRTQYRNNAYGAHQAWVTLRTDWCWNGRTVTYANSTKSHGTGTFGVLFRWKEWSEFSEGWYAYNNHTNGGVKTVAQGHWEYCLKYCADFDMVARTYAHYDGTWTASGHNYY